MRPEMIDKIREWYILAIGAAVLIGGVAIASYQPGNVPGQAPARTDCPDAAFSRKGWGGATLRSRNRTAGWWR